MKTNKQSKEDLGFGELKDFPGVKITLSARKKLQYYIDLCPKEISGLGAVERRGNDFLITNLLLFKQNVSEVTTELDQREIGRFLTHLIETGQDSALIRVWWHSHVNMDSWWSGGDQATIAGIESEYIISLVGNKKGEIKCRLDLFSPFHMSVENIPLKLVVPEDGELKRICEQEIKEKVKQIVPRRLFGSKIEEVETEEGRSDIPVNSQEIEEKDTNFFPEENKGSKE